MRITEKKLRKIINSVIVELRDSTTAMPTRYVRPRRPRRS